MFGGNKGTTSPAGHPKPRKASGAKDTAVTILTSGCHFNGKLYCRGSSRIGGRIEGQIVSEGLLIVEEEAQIFAEIKAEEAIIQGKVSGKLEAKNRVELHSTSRFDGELMTPALIIHEGAQFNGRSTMIPPSVQTGADEGKRSKVIPMVHNSPLDSSNADSKGREQRDVAVMRTQDLFPSVT